MSDSTRRGFLKVAGAGVAVAGAAAVVPAALDHRAHTTSTHDVVLPAAASGALLAHVADVHSGRVALMVEGHEVTVTDHQLVARLVHAMHFARQTTV